VDQSCTHCHFCSFACFVCCWRERQFGNLSILLQEGTESDQYDFLDLHIQGWRAEAAQVHQKCFPWPTARRLSAELVRAAFDDPVVAVATMSGKVARTDASPSPSRRRRLCLPEYPLHNPRFTHDTSKPVNVSAPYNFTRPWHPYDWYIQANTQVRTSIVCTFIHPFIHHPRMDPSPTQLDLFLWRVVPLVCPPPIHRSNP
jgi:hypothetical protein